MSRSGTLRIRIYTCIWPVLISTSLKACVFVPGYAVDPSVDSAMGSSVKVVGTAPSTKEGELKTVFETIPKRPKDKRKRVKNDDPGDIEGFLGPWGRFENEMEIAKPNEVWILHI